jgi:plastocyanin
MTTRALLATIALAATLATGTAACSGGGSAASVTPPPDAAASVTAKGFAFEDRDVKVPAGQAFHLFFRNLDGDAHNIAIYQDSTASRPLFVGDRVTDAAVTYQVPALPAGTWFFRCDVHPNMQGAITAGSSS